MKKDKLIWHLFPSYMLVTLLALTAITLYASRSLRDFYLDETENSLLARAQFFASKVTSMIDDKDFEQINDLTKDLGEQTKSRVTVILPDGLVVADSLEDPAKMENHSDRPELKNALSNDYGSSIRYSSTVGYNMMYVAVPLKSKGKVTGLLRVSVSTQAINQTLMDIFIRLIFFGLIIAALATLICWIVAKRIAQPIEDLRQGAEKFANGDFCHRIVPSNIGELKNLSFSLNNMATQLDNRIKAVIEHRKEIDTILSSMVEGIFVVDRHEHIVTINSSAASFIHVDQDGAKGKLIQEVIRNTVIQQFIRDALSTEKPLEQQISITNDRQLILRVYGTPLYGLENEKVGELIVLRDITKLSILENHRREFVTNVSHEIKTPLTSIKGFVETLLDGSLEKPADAKRFLGIIAKQTDRLNILVDDLLTLSKIETDSEKKEIKTSMHNVVDVVRSSIQLCELKAKNKNIQVSFDDNANISCLINPLLLEQAFVNLIDNAIKYSPSRTTVKIEAVVNDFEVLIQIKDEGCGIDSEHLPRLFERFYRVDKSRSSDVGGTGLGLAIVKYILCAHDGHVTVQSEFGKGSVFTIHLPNIQAQ